MLTPVFQKVDNAIHRINHYPLDSAIGFLNTHPVDSAIQLLNNWGQIYILIPHFWKGTNFFVFVLFVYLSFSLELPHTTTTKVTPASKYPMRINVYKVVPKQISDFTPI